MATGERGGPKLLKKLLLTYEECSAPCRPRFLVENWSRVT